MQFWINIASQCITYYSIWEGDVRVPKCSISLPRPFCAHASSGAVASSRTLQTTGGSEKTDLATDDAEPLFGAASFVESEKFATKIAGDIWRWMVFFQGFRNESRFRPPESAGSVSGLHLQLQTSSWSDTSLVSYCKALGRF